MDFKERFLNFETFKGVYLLPVGLIGLWVTLTHIQYLLYIIGFAYFGYMAIEGARKISVNRIKQQVAVRKAIDFRKFVNSEVGQVVQEVKKKVKSARTSSK